MNQHRLNTIVAQVYALTRDLSAEDAETWEDILLIHRAIAQGFGTACGKAYASGPEAEAQAYTLALLDYIVAAAKLGYDMSQTQVATWRLDEIAKEAGNGSRD